MKRFLLLLLFFAAAISVSGSHLRGGQVYWDALGNNQYRFYFTGIVVCGLTPNNFVLESNAFSSAIPLVFVGSENYNGVCNSCEYSQIYHYQSAVITVPVPTSGPWYFHVQGSTLQGMISTNLDNSEMDVHIIRSVMKVGGENKSSARFNMKQVLDEMATNQFMFELISPSADSLVFGPFHPLKEDYNNNPITNAVLAPGYTAQTPFSPMDSWHSEAGWFINGLNDTIQYNTTLGFRLDQYEGNDWYSRTNLSFTTYRGQPYPFVPAVNEIPSFSTSPVMGQWQVRDSVLQYTSAFLGEKIQLDINASDFDIDPNTGLSQTITAELDYGTLQGSGVVKPTLTANGNQGSLSSTQTNSVRFEWTVPGTLPEGFYRFYVRFYDDECPTPGLVSIPILVHVKGVFGATYEICSGGSTTLLAPFTGTTYQWFPTAGLSNPTHQSTQASPTTTTTYYCAIDGDTVGVYTVEVGQSVTPLTSKPQSNEIQLDNPQDFEEHALLYYYYPIAFNDTLFSVTANGLYHVAGKNVGCFDLSADIQISSDSLVSSVSVRSALSQDDLVTLNAGDWYELEVFNANLSGFQYSVSEVIIPGAQISGKSGGVRLFVNDGGQLDTLMPTVLDGHSISFVMPSSQSFLQPGSTITLVVDSGSIQLPMLRNVMFPTMHSFGALSASDGMMGSDTLDSDLVPIAFRGHYYASLKEVEANYVIYPQPAHSSITVKGVNEGAEYTLYSMTGALVSQGVLEGDMKVSVSELPTGVYVIQIIQDGQVSSQRVQIQR